LVGWLCIVTNIDRLVSLGEISPFARVAAVVICIGLLLAGVSRGRLWIYVGATLLSPFVRVLTGEEILGTGFAYMVVETCIFVVTVGLSNKVLNSIGTLKTVAEDAVTIQLGAELFETGRGDQGLQEEMSRARRFERPLTMITVSAKGQRKQQELHQLLVKAQREVIDRYVEGRLYRLLQQKVRDCDIVTRQNGQFLILMPETDRQYAQTILERVQEAAMDEIGLTVNAGIASFPSEERTLVGLLDRASTEMDANLLSSPPRTPK
jgi:hypothetical protein